MTDRNEHDGDELRLIVNGQQFTGWEEIRVIRQLEAAAGSFRVTVADRIPWPIVPGDSCEVELRDARRRDLLLTGTVDDLSMTGDKGRTSTTVAGRDRTADLVDCSEVSDPGEWRGLILSDLVAEIASPFGIPVQTEIQRLGQAPFETFKIQPGEKAWNAIERAIRSRGVLAFTDGDGALTLSNPASRTSSVELVEGSNVLSWNLRTTRRQRFRTYIVRGQGQGSDQGFGDTVAAVEGRAIDENVGGFRPLLVLSEGTVTFQSAADRAQWEASIRAARAATLEVTVQGWRKVSPGGEPWRVNELVPVRIPSAQIDSTMLVKEIQFTRSIQGGSLTKVLLTRRDAFQRQAEIQVDARDDPFFDLVEKRDVR